MTFPRHKALMARWRVLPPAAMQLARIAAAIGIKPAPEAQPVQSAQDFMKTAAAAGLPVMNHRPDDPMLDFLDLPEA